MPRTVPGLKIRIVIPRPTIAISIACVVLCARPAGAAPSPFLENSDDRFAITDMHGKPAPAWTLRDWKNSTPLNLADLKGKIVVIDFWATWCPACLGKIPHNNHLRKKYEAQGVVFIGVCSPDGAARLGQVVKERGIEYPVAVDQSETTFKRYRANSFPDHYIIDRAGNLRWGDIVGEHIEKAVKILLAETKD